MTASVGFSAGCLKSPRGGASPRREEPARRAEKPSSPSSPARRRRFVHGDAPVPPGASHARLRRASPGREARRRARLRALLPLARAGRGDSNAFAFGETETSFGLQAVLSSLSSRFARGAARAAGNRGTEPSLRVPKTAEGVRGDPTLEPSPKRTSSLGDVRFSFTEPRRRCAALPRRGGSAVLSSSIKRARSRARALRLRLAPPPRRRHARARDNGLHACCSTGWSRSPRARAPAALDAPVVTRFHRLFLRRRRAPFSRFPRAVVLRSAAPAPLMTYVWISRRAARTRRARARRCGRTSGGSVVENAHVRSVQKRETGTESVRSRFAPRATENRKHKEKSLSFRLRGVVESDSETVTRPSLEKPTLSRGRERVAVMADAKAEWVRSVEPRVRRIRARGPRANAQAGVGVCPATSPRGRAPATRAAMRGYRRAAQSPS